MVEDYRIKFHTGRAELTGQYTVNRRGSPGDLERRSKRRDKGRWGDRTFRTG